MVCAAGRAAASAGQHSSPRGRGSSGAPHRPRGRLPVASGRGGPRRRGTALVGRSRGGDFPGRGRGRSVPYASEHMHTGIEEAAAVAGAGQNGASAGPAAHTAHGPSLPAQKSPRGVSSVRPPVSKSSSRQQLHQSNAAQSTQHIPGVAATVEETLITEVESGDAGMEDGQRSQQRLVGVDGAPEGVSISDGHATQPIGRYGSTAAESHGRGDPGIAATDDIELGDRSELLQLPRRGQQAALHVHLNEGRARKYVKGLLAAEEATRAGTSERQHGQSLDWKAMHAPAHERASIDSAPRLQERLHLPSAPKGLGSSMLPMRRPLPAPSPLLTGGGMPAPKPAALAGSVGMNPQGLGASPLLPPRPGVLLFCR